MVSRKLETASALLSASLVFPLADYVRGALAVGVATDSYAVVARPLAFFIVFSIVAVAGGAVLGAAISRFSNVSRRSLALGCGLAGATAAALMIASITPPPAFASRVGQAVLWSGIWAVTAWLLAMLFAGFEAHREPPSSFERILRVAPLLLAAAGLYLLLSEFAPGWRWAPPLIGAALAAWSWFQPAVALGACGILAASLAAAPWLGPAEPDLDFGSGMVGAAHSLTPPRIILISIDTLRAVELGYMGGKAVATPGLDRLAADSVIFANAISPSGWTLPAFSSLMLGVSPEVHGAWTRFDAPSDVPQSLAERLAEAGYRTAKISSNLFLTETMTGPALSKGFDVLADYPSFERPRTLAFEFLSVRTFLKLGEQANTEDLFGWAADFVGRNQDDPFYLWLHIYDPHQPYLPPPEFAPEGKAPVWNDPDADPEVRPKTAEEAERMRALYRAEIAYVDNRLNRFLDRLRELNLYDDALIVLVSDHGEEFLDHADFGHGHTLYNELLHVPLLFKLPGGAKKGRIDDRVATLGLTPTILELAGVPYDAEDFSGEPIPMDGPMPSTPIFSSGTYEVEAKRSVIFDSFKLIHVRDFGHEELFDLDADPRELNDLAAERPEIVQRGLELIRGHEERAKALRDRLGVVDRGPVQYGPAQQRLLRSLGYVQ